MKEKGFENQGLTIKKQTNENHRAHDLNNYVYDLSETFLIHESFHDAIVDQPDFRISPIKAPPSDNRNNHFARAESR